MNTVSRKSLIIRTTLIYVAGLLTVGVLIFLPAGSLKYWNGWLFIAALFIPMLFIMVHLIVKEPDLLVKRLKTREKEKTQKIYLVLSFFVFFAVFILPGLDYRFKWSDVPLAVVVGATILMVAGYLMFFLVMKQNAYASRVIEIQEGQQLIDTGLYSYVRHPMYLAATILYGFAPLVLGSFYALIPYLLIPVLLMIRIKNEEKVLRDGLKGYREYMDKVKYRLIPYVW